MQNKTPTQEPTNSGFFHPIAWILVLLVALIAGWCGFWFYAANQVEERVDLFIEDAVKKGTEINCSNKEIKGFPFRLGIFCNAVTLTNHDKSRTFSASNLRTVAQAYAPNHLIAELDSPAKLTHELLGNFQLDWTLMHASLRYGFSGLNELTGEVLALKSNQILAGGKVKPDLEVEKGQFFLKSIELKSNENETATADLDTAFNIKTVSFLNPMFSALPKLDIAAEGSYKGLGGAFQRNQLQDFDIKASGLSGDMRHLRLSISGEDESGVLHIAGPWKINRDGEITAKIIVTVSNIDALLKTIEKTVPELLKVATGMAQGLKTIGKPTELEGKPAQQIELNITNNEIRIGFFKIGKLPKAF